MAGWVYGKDLNQGGSQVFLSAICDQHNGAKGFGALRVDGSAPLELFSKGNWGVNVYFAVCGFVLIHHQIETYSMQLTVQDNLVEKIS